jgi:hypothetical protein
MPEPNPGADYGGSGNNKRLQHPDRKADWARISPYPFLLRRWPRRDWSNEFEVWWPGRKPAPSNQLSIPLAISDVIWFEVVRRTPLSVECLTPNKPSPFDPLRQAIHDEVDKVLAKYDKPLGVLELSLYDALQALSESQPLKVETLGQMKVEYTRLPRDFDYWRDWIARKGPIPALIWVDDRFRTDGTYDPQGLTSATVTTVKPAAVVIAGYNHVFKNLDSTDLLQDDFIVRPAFQVGPAANPISSITVKEDFARFRFLEAFGVTVTVTP